MKRVIVTGASGFIGKAVTRRLLENGNEVYAVVRNSKKMLGINEENLHITECDLNDYHHLSDLIGEKCNAMFHFAWAGAEGDSRMDKGIQKSNIKNSCNAIFAARELGCECFIGAGSQAEYGICKGEVTEKYLESPITEYGESKLVVKRFGLEYGSTVGLRFIWPRIFSAYGIGNSEGTMIMSVLKKMIHNVPVELSVCTQMWDYINVEDVASAYLSLWERGESGVYNIASGKYRPLREFVLEMKQVAESQSELRFGVVPMTLTGQGFMPNVDKLMLLGWKTKWSFGQGISEIVQVLKETNN